MATGSFRRWERAMLAFIAVSLLQIPLVLLSYPHWGSAGRALVAPGIQGGVSSDAVLLIIAIVGTTVAPWQLFFQQSNVVDKRITPRFISYERVDTVLGSVVVIIGAAALMMTADWAARSTGTVGQFSDAGGIAHLLSLHRHLLGPIFAIVLLDASIVGAAAVTLSTSYTFGDVFGLQHSLHRGFREAKPFYASYTAMVVAAAVITLLPGAPLGLITTAVQALAGLLLPSASVFLLLLCNDPQVLGPWVNPRWLNLLAGFIVAVLLLLSGILMATTLFPHLTAAAVAAYLAGAMVFAGEVGRDGGGVQVREQGGGHQDAGQQQQDGDDEPGEQVQPAGVHPRPEDLRVVAQQQQEDTRAGQQQPRERLHRGGDQPERSAGEQGDHRGGHHHGGVGGVERLGLPETAVQRMLQAEDITERVGGGQGHLGGADDAGVEQHDGKDRAEEVPVQRQQVRDPAGVAELPEGAGAARGPVRRHHQRRRADDHYDRAEHGVDALVADEPGGDPLVDDVGLLEEQLPGRHGGADDRDDQQHGVGADATLDAGHHKRAAGTAPVRIGQQHQRDLQQGTRDVG